MTVRWQVLLPFVALVLVVGGALTAMLATGLGDRADTPSSASNSNGDDPTVTARLAGDVCQGILSRPAAGQPKVFSSHYATKTEQNGIAIVASEGVSSAAIENAKKTVERVFKNNDLESELAKEGAYIIITRGTENILDLPEFGCLEKDSPGAANLVSHACGVADRADYPVIAVNERDLTGDRRGPCRGLNILYHELGHLVQGWTIDPIDYFDIKIFYQKALDAGLYRQAYAATNPNEYFAEATQAYFLTQDLEGKQDRDWLKKYDPDIFAIVDRVYGG